MWTSRRFLTAVVASLALLVGATGSAGELAVLHSVLAEDSGQAQAATPCKGPMGVPCGPGVAGAPTPPDIAAIAGYAGFGAFYFLLSAIWLAVKSARQRSAVAP